MLILPTGFIPVLFTPSMSILCSHPPLRNITLAANCPLHFPKPVGHGTRRLRGINNADVDSNLIVEQDTITKLLRAQVILLHPKLSDIATQHTRRRLFCVYAILFI